MVFSRTTSLMAVALLAVASAITPTTQANANVYESFRPRVEPAIHRKLRQQGTVNLIVTMRDGTSAALTDDVERTAAATPQSRASDIAALVDRLEKNAQTSQADLQDLLSAETPAGDPLYKTTSSFWISNQIYVGGATQQLVDLLSSREDVLEVVEEEVIPMPDTTAVAVNVTMTARMLANVGTLAAGYGVDKLRAAKAWASGIDGTGVLVGSIDTGVIATHEVLRQNFLGAYGWYDPQRKSATPNDGQGHGTHTMGTIAGSNGIGVAPGVTWMACRGCRDGVCYSSELIACLQFMTCPTDTNGGNKDCSKAPHVVNNSWSGTPGKTTYASAVATMRSAGIIPVFANGNSGPACGTANSPADYSNVIAVGATDSGDVVSASSSRGPSVYGDVRPHVTAPGVDVRSAWNTSDTAYMSESGSSMATPHVTGTIALMLQARPGLSFDQVKRILQDSPDQASISSAGQTCGGIADSAFPNNVYGYGRVNALRAVKVATLSLGSGATYCGSYQSELPCNAAYFCTYNKVRNICQPWW